MSAVDLEGGPFAAAPDVLGRKSSVSRYLTAGNSNVHATAADDPAFAVNVEFGNKYAAGIFVLYLTPEQARALAQALTQSADHYDAETARLGGAK